MCFNEVSTALGQLSPGTTLQAVGNVATGFSRLAQGDAQRSLARADAMYERDAARQQAEMILKAGRREQGAARAATAASGVRLDEFSDIPVDEIRSAAAQDAAMTMLSGNRRARSLEFSGDAAGRAGRAGMTESLFRAGSVAYTGWKNPKRSTNPFYDGTTGDFAFQQE